MNKEKLVSFRLEEPFWNAIMKIAALEDRSKGAILRRAIRMYLTLQQGGDFLHAEEVASYEKK